MQAKSRYIVLFYDHAEKVLPMKQLLQHESIPIELDCVEDFQQLLSILDKRLPDIIIVYANNSPDRFIGYLKNIRENYRTDEIPVYVFTQLPGKQTIEDILGN
jgi:DNA-binding response OmpR family regulator